MKKRPQLSSAEMLQLKWALGGLLALLSVWTVFFMEIEAWTLLAVATVVIPLATLRPVFVWRVPRWVHRAAFPVIVVIFLTDLGWGRQPLPALIRLDMMLIVYRAIVVRRRRDDLQLIVLGLFLVVVAGVLTVSLGFAVQILAFTACALALLLAVTITDATGEVMPPLGAGLVREEAGGPPPAWMLGGWRALARRLREVNDWRLITLGGLLFTGVVGVSALLFLAIPRFELNNSLFLDRLIQKKSRSGFSENVQFGEVVDIQQDTSVALTVDVSDPARIPATPYWRMLVLDDYVGGGFKMSKELRAELERQRDNRVRLPGGVRYRPDESIWTFYFEPGVSRYLPLPGEFRQLSFMEPQQVAASGRLRLVALQNEPPKMLPYRLEGIEPGASVRDARFALRWRDREAATAVVATARGVAERAVTSESTAATAKGGTGAAGAPRRAREVWFTNLEDSLTPGEVEQVRGWVEAWGVPAGNVPEFARRATRWLEERHSYSLASTLPTGGGDPLVRWMASREPGHCELFAGAMVVLARAAGYPARLVTGFKGFTWNPGSGSLVIRNSDAHAWVEIFDGKEAWLRVDPTPGATAANEASASLEGEAALRHRQDNGWGARLDSLRVFWYRRIVNFDQGSQVELARAAKNAVEGTGKRLRAWLEGRVEAVRRWATGPWSVGRWLGLAGVVGGLAGVVLGWRWVGRSAWLSWRSERRASVDPVRREAGKWLRRLPDAGAVRTDLERLRYGPRETWPEPERVFGAARREARARR